MTNSVAPAEYHDVFQGQSVNGRPRASAAGTYSETCSKPSTMSGHLARREDSPRTR